MKRHPLLVNLLVSVVSTLLLVLLLEGFASVLLSVRVAKHGLRMQEESHVAYDPDLGWSNRPGLHIEHLYEDKSPFTTNSQGFRAREDYAREVAPGKFRIVALGDSFTMGFGVGDAESYPAQMQALCPALQTVNMGQGGYGIDQDYLWYKRDGVKLDSQVLLFAVIAHDFYRMAGDNFIGYGKPVLKARGGTLVVENVPPPNWAWRAALRRARDFLESLATVRLARWIANGNAPQGETFYGTVDEAVYAAAGLAFDDLARLSAQRKQRLVLAYLPTSDLLAREPTREVLWLEDYARRRGVVFINLVPDFNRLTPAQIARLFRPDYHYTVEGNRFVAGRMLARMAEGLPGFPGCPAGSGPPEPPGSHPVPDRMP